MTKEINEENIRVAAYYIWEQAGCPEGKDKECWIKACEQLFAPKKSVAVKTQKKVSKPKEAAPKDKKTPVKVAKASAKTVAKPAAKKPTVAPKAALKKVKATPFYGSRK